MRTTVRNSYTPKTGDYCNTIVIDNDNGAQYIFDSDGVFSTYTSKQQEGAPMGYVDAKSANALENAKIYANAKDAEVLQAAKDYTDQHGGGGGVSKQYVDDQDSATLQSAKNYTDAEVSGIAVPTKTSQLTNDSGFITSSSIPTVNNATLTIQKNGTDVQTFTANSSANKTANITVPTKTSDLTNDSGFITSSSIPTVNNATLTIQKNGTNVQTFTANSSTNKTANITVPVFTLTSTDPGEGGALAANNFIGVYQ